MMQTRKQIKMDRQKLEAITMEKLGKEVLIYRLLTKATKCQLTAAITIHLQKWGPACGYADYGK